MRKFKRPACEKGWNDRLAFPIPWKKVWRTRSFFTTPRDRAAGNKLLHRNLYVAKHDPHDPKCRACDEVENQIHLAQCAILRLEYWDHVLLLLKKLGMPTPQDITTFLCTTALAPNKVIHDYLSGIWSLAWRCLYAAVVTSRIENKPLDCEAAFKRLIAMIHSRLRAYGVRWRRWVDTSIYQYDPNVIPKRHSDKMVIAQDQITGTYTISHHLTQLALDLQLVKA